MKTTKLFFMAALALTFAACSNDDNDLTTPQPQQAKGITITATLAPKTGGTDTRAVSEGTDKIVSTWEVNEQIAVLYTKDATQYAADATVTDVDGDGTATIEFTVEDGTPDGTACTLVYPYTAAKADHSGVKDAATLLAAQDGTLNANLDVRVGAGTIQTTTPGLTVTTQPAAQYAIFKFTTKTSDGSATIDVTSLTVTTGGQDYVITPASATSELYAALPPISGQEVTFTATGSDSKNYTVSKASTTFTAGKYYQSNIKLTEVPSATTLDASSTEWTENSTIANDLTISSAVTVSADITLTIPEGKTLTVTGGINAEGHTLTVSGAGTLNVTGTNGANGSGTHNASGYTVGNAGGAGSAGFTGTLVIDGAAVNVTGGNGGTGAEGEEGAGNGGNGAAGVSGSITVNSGSATVTGGNGGNVGATYFDDYPSKGGNGGSGVSGSVTVGGGSTTVAGDAGGSKGRNGSAGSTLQAVGRSITATDVTAEESDDNSTWTAITGTASTKRYVRAQ